MPFKFEIRTDFSVSTNQFHLEKSVSKQTVVLF